MGKKEAISGCMFCVAFYESVGGKRGIFGRFGVWLKGMGCDSDHYWSSSIKWVIYTLSA